MTAWRIPIAGKYLSGNSRAHWRRKAEHTASIRDQVWAHAKRLKIPNLDRRCATQLVWYPATANRPDPDNLWPTDKAAVDGLQQARVLSNDSQEFVRRSVPVIGSPMGAKSGVRRLWLYVTELDEPITPLVASIVVPSEVRL